MYLEYISQGAGESNSTAANETSGSAEEAKDSSASEQLIIEEEKAQSEGESSESMLMEEFKIKNRRDFEAYNSVYSSDFRMYNLEN